MLDFLRKRKRSWTILLMIGVISFVFIAYFGAGSLEQDPSLKPVAEVNGEPIRFRELEVRFQKLMQTFRNRSRQDIDSLNLRMALLDNLIQNRLLLQEARRLGLRMTDQEIADSIAENPAFHANGRFDVDRYTRVLRFQRITREQFEQERREELIIQKLFDIIRDSVHVLEAEVRERYRLEKEKINLNFIRFSKKEYISKTEASAEEVKGYYDQNKDELREPLRVQVEYLAYPYALFSSKIQVSQKDIEEYYDLYRDTKFHQKKALNLRQIFFRLPSKADIKATEEVRSKAQKVLDEAHAGKDFAELAKKYSEDSTASRGGIVGFLSKGELLPDLEKVAFALKKDDISDLVKTSFGFHILKLEAIREEKTQTLMEAEKKIIATLQEKRGKEAGIRAADLDRTRVLDGTGFTTLAKERKISVKVTPFFRSNERIKEIGPVDTFYTSSFALAPQRVSPVVEGPKVVYLIKLKERKEPHVPDLEAIRKDVTRRVKEKKALERANERGLALLAELKENKDIGQLASKHKLTLEETGLFPRNAFRIPKVGFLEDMRPGGIPLFSGSPIPNQLYSQNDALYLFALKESQEADLQSFDKEKDSLLKTALEERRQRALGKFIEGLKVKAKIEVETESLLAG